MSLEDFIKNWGGCDASTFSAGLGFAGGCWFLSEKDIEPGVVDLRS